MGFIKTVLGKFLQDGKYALGFVGVHIVKGLCLGYKYRLLLRHYLGLFLAHCAAQDIRFTQSITGYYARSHHNLFLINKNAIGLLNQIFQEGMWNLQLRRVFFSLYKLVDKLHRPWTVKGD